MLDGPMISTVTTHKIENSDPNSSTFEFPALRVSHQVHSSSELGSGQMGCLFAAYANPVLFTIVRKLGV